MALLVRRYEMWRGAMAGRVGSAKPRRVQMFLSGGLEDTAACEVSLVSVLLHELSLFMFRGRQQHAVLHAVSLTHRARTWKTFTFPQGL